MVMSHGTMSLVLPCGCDGSYNLNHGSGAVNAKGGPHTGSYTGLYMWDPGGNKYSLEGLNNGPMGLNSCSRMIHPEP